MKLLSLFGQAADEYYADPYMYEESLYDTTATTQISDEAAAGMMAFMLIFGLILIAVTYVVTAFLMSRIFKKAGVEPWKAWVPIYNTWVMLEIGGQKGYWAVLALVPFVNIVSLVFMIIAQYNIGLKLQKEGWFVLFAIFLPLVWLIWLAFDKSTWQGVPAAKLATVNGAPSEKPTEPTENKPTPPTEPPVPPTQTPPVV